MKPAVATSFILNIAPKRTFAARRSTDHLGSFALSAGSSDGAEAERLTSTSAVGAAVAAGVAGGGGSLPPRLRPPFKDRLPWSRWAGGYEMTRSGYVEAGMSEDHAAMVGLISHATPRQMGSDDTG
eukprot:CAMPEP_0177269406 /NCGR_PEP_ID=MMETSP0367-20130122/64345_1 /TAXON_ID=447022 ORGANISM="Scrippsiella hangoei-like, Strain SHHI-4" /NCGR_SAMPLE_ID=MMETSP0367 /ASSEMBLY_ACC=CAM_ASM_000362 /LENGTH=125 /DNA_ID=CAMNT_0018725129 /DNA_START=159 /DNA_END=533 /DNA_ORIENTATION=-